MDRSSKRSKSAKAQLGRPYQFTHTRCIPCLDPYALFCDSSYDWERWQRHKSWSRHIPTVRTCLAVCLWYWPPVLLTVGIACLLGVYHEKAEPRGAPNISNRNFTEPFTLTSFALALLLVFRTNQSYDRWWEARKILGGMLGVTRDIMRIAMSVSRPNCQHLIAMMARWTIAMPYVLRHHVTEFHDVAEPLKHVLLSNELALLQHARHKPTLVIQALSDAAIALCTADINYTLISSRISDYADFVAAAERLLRQPLPIAYTRHTSRFMITYLVFLPFALWQTCGWATPIIGGVVAFLLIGIENIGVQIEQPFNVLPIDIFSAIIEDNVNEQMQSVMCSILKDWGVWLVYAEGKLPVEQLREHTEQLVDFAAMSQPPSGKVDEPHGSHRGVWPTGVGKSYSNAGAQEVNKESQPSPNRQFVPRDAAKQSTTDSQEETNTSDDSYTLDIDQLQRRISSEGA